MKLQKDSKILVIGAHFDDIELGCGGFIINLIQNNFKVKMVVMTTPDNQEREKEGLISKYFLGIEELQMLEFKDMYVPYNGDSVKELNTIVDSFNPDLILTHWIFDTHQDHKNTALSTLSACRYKNNILMYEPIHPAGKSYCSFKPQIYIDISNSIDKKIKALKLHKSQYKKYGNDWLEAIKGRAKVRGFESNNKYAEAFELVRMEIKL